MFRILFKIKWYFANFGKVLQHVLLIKAAGAFRAVCESLPWAGLSESGAHICLAGALSGNWNQCFLPPAAEPRSHCHSALDDAGGTLAPWEARLTQKPLSPSVLTLRKWRSVARGSALGFAWLRFSGVCMWFSVRVCVLCVFTSVQVSVCVEVRGQYLASSSVTFYL